MTNKLFCNNFLKTMLLSLIVFKTIKISLSLYLLVLTTVWILFFLNFNIKKSKYMLELFITISVSSFWAYSIIKGFDSNKIYINLTECIWSISILIFILILSIYSFFISLNKEEIDKKIYMIPKRKDDLDNVLYYLELVNILGINGIWGFGKSFLVNELKKIVNDEYEIIEIDILACNLDELMFILINEIEKVMYKSKIGSKYSRKLKNFIVDDNNVKKIFSIFINDKYSYSETIRGFKEELSRLDKKILIIYEDIDRISEKDNIKKIFWISEKLSSDKIKIIYQYDEVKLKELELTNDYIEKYIPYKINLTELNFFEIIEFIIKTKNINKWALNIEDFDFLKDYVQRNRYDILSKKFNIKTTFYMNIENVVCSIRKVEHFLAELEITLKKSEEYTNNKETVISFLYLKHFIDNIYERLTISDKLTDTLTFKFNERDYTINDLYCKYKNNDINKEDIEKIFENRHNIENYCILKLFDYRDDIEIVEEKDVNRRIELIETEPMKTLNERLHNQKKDKIIWSLIANGKSKYTNYEFTANKFVRDVLNKPIDKRIDAYKSFMNDMFNLDEYTYDNTTPFLIGTSHFIELYKCLRVIDTNVENEIKLIDIYIKINNTINIDEKFIRFINYSSLKNRVLYIEILERINKLNIIGNLNSKIAFIKFLKIYINALMNFGYIELYHYNYIYYSDKILGNEKLIVEDLERLSKKLKKLNDNINKKLEIEQVKYELEVIIKFVEKMIKIITFNEKAKDTCGYNIKSSISSKSKNDDEFKRLLNLKKEPYNKFKNEIENSYKNGNIDINEIQKLID